MSFTPFVEKPEYIKGFPPGCYIISMSMPIVDQIIGRNVERLRRHGITSLISSVHDRGAILFVNGRTGRITNVFYETKPGHSLFNAFTTGDIVLNDNFDPSPDGKLIENCVFGAMKTLLERYGWAKHPEYHSDFSWGLKFMNNLSKADEEINKISKKQGITSGAVLEAVRNRAPRLSALKTQLSYSPNLSDAAAAYFDVREELLQDIAYADPRIGKLGLGRTALFDLINEEWKVTHTATVFYTRRYILSKHPDVAYLFCLLHKFAETAEVSTNDDLWAVMEKAPADSKTGGSLDVFFPNTDANQRNITMADIELKQPTRLLGVTNKMVALSMMGDPITDADFNAKLTHTAHVLQECGWVKWFHTFVYPEDEDKQVLKPARLPQEYIDLLNNSTVHDAHDALKKLAHGLRDMRSGSSTSGMQ
jgi:hypothetical protein